MPGFASSLAGPCGRRLVGSEIIMQELHERVCFILVGQSFRALVGAHMKTFVCKLLMVMFAAASVAVFATPAQAGRSGGSPPPIIFNPKKVTSQP